MTLEEAKKIYEDWLGSTELMDKLFNIFSHIPESFLPYPSEVLEEALNIVAKDFFDAGDKKRAKDVQNLMVLHIGTLHITPEGYSETKISDERALDLMKRDIDFICSDSKLKKAKLKSLKDLRNSWLETKRQDQWRGNQ